MVLSSQHGLLDKVALSPLRCRFTEVDRGSKSDLVSLVYPNIFRLLISYFGFGVLVQVSCADRLIVTRLPVIITPPLTITHILVLIPIASQSRDP